MYRIIQLIDAAFTPMCRRNGRTGHRHDAPFVDTFTFGRVMFHAEIVTHFMGQRCGDHTQYRTVVHRNATGIFVSTNWPFERFAHDTPFECLFGQQLCIVVRMLFHKDPPAIAQEILQRLITIARKFNLVFLSPHHNTNQCDENIQRNVQLQQLINFIICFSSKLSQLQLAYRIDDVRNVLAISMNLF